MNPCIRLSILGLVLGEHADRWRVAARIDTRTRTLWASPLQHGVPASYAEAQAAAKTCSLLGFRDWRLMTLDDWHGLLLSGQQAPAMLPDFFGEPADHHAWTCTPIGEMLTHVHAVSIDRGYSLAAEMQYDTRQIIVCRPAPKLSVPRRRRGSAGPEHTRRLGL